MVKSAGSKRPGGRTARTRDQVFNAVNAILTEGIEPVTVRGVAERSGVHEVTIYRREGTAEALVLDVAADRLEEMSPLPDTGDLRADLLAWARSVASALERPEGFAPLEAVVAARQSTLHAHRDVDVFDYFRERAGQLQNLLDRSGRQGATSPGVEAILDIILAPHLSAGRVRIRGTQRRSGSPRRPRAHSNLRVEQ